MSSLWKDIVFGARMLAKSPGITLVAVLSLALGVGANTTIFGWIKSIILRPLAGVARQEEVVAIGNLDGRGAIVPFSHPDFVDYRDQNTTFSGIVGFAILPLNMAQGDRPERIWGSVVSANYFSVLGVKTLLGRGFLPEENSGPGAHPVVVISHSLWQRRFGGSAGALGQTIQLNGANFTIVGVAPPAFVGTVVGLSFDCWVPLMMQPQLMASGSRLDRRDMSWLLLLGRLKPNTEIVQAESNLQAISIRIERAGGTSDEQRRLRVLPMWQSPWGATAMLGPVLVILMGVVGLVLLITCANIANLLLARATGRRKEIAVRLAIGASRGRLVRQLLTESLMLSLLGGAAGLAMARYTGTLVLGFVPQIGLPIGIDLSLDWASLGFTLLLACGTGIFFGLVPAFASTKADLSTALKVEAGTSLGRSSRFAPSNLILVFQIALALVVIVGAALFLQSMWNTQKVDPGFEANHVLLASIDLGAAKYEEAAGELFVRRALAEVGQLPFVSKASFASSVPLGFGSAHFTGFGADGYQPKTGEDMTVPFSSVGPEYLEAMGIGLVEGREFTPQDDKDSRRVAMVNETFAKRYWPGESAIGKHVHTGGDWLEVVGVVKDGKYMNLAEPPQPFLYLPLLQVYESDVVLQVRTEEDPSRASVVSAVRDAIERLDPNLPVYDTKPMVEHMKASLFTSQLVSSLLSCIGVLALALAAAGIYSLMAYNVARRTREIGIRMAIGASRMRIFALVIGKGLALAVSGVALGGAVAFGIARVIASQLYGIAATDPATIGSVALLLICVALAACIVPAWRATQVDPLTALRA